MFYPTMLHINGNVDKKFQHSILYRSRENQTYRLQHFKLWSSFATNDNKNRNLVKEKQKSIFTPKLLLHFNLFKGPTNILPKVCNLKFVLNLFKELNFVILLAQKNSSQSKDFNKVSCL